jgi:hypothetical protein
MSELVQDVKTLVRSVNEMVNVDMGIQELIFPSRNDVFHTTTTIEYDMALVEGVASEYNSFANTAKIVKKDGFSTVVLEALNYNESISHSVINANSKKIGQNIYGDGFVDPLMIALLEGVGKIRLNQLAGRKRDMYEALTTHKIANGFEGVNGKQDIVFPVPDTNRIALDDGVGKKYWSNATDSLPITNIKTLRDAMKRKPKYVIMNDNTYANFLASSEVVANPVNLDGKVQNFFMNTSDDMGREFYRAGKIQSPGLVIDVYVESQERKIDSTTTTPFMPDKYVVLASDIGETHYAGIPTVVAGVGIENIAAEWHVQELIEYNPVQETLIVKTAPTPILKNGYGFGSLIVEAL